MPRVRDLLYRFRPAAAPGSATSAGVPVDVGAESAAELAPLFARLTECEARCARIVLRAEGDAAEILRTARDRAAAIVATATARADAERATAAAEALRADGAGAAETVGRAEAADLRIRARARIPAQVALVVDGVALLLAGAPPTAEPAVDPHPVGVA